MKQCVHQEQYLQLLVTNMEQIQRDKYSQADKETLIQLLIQRDQYIDQCEEEKSSLLMDLENFKIQIEQLISQNQKAFSAFDQASKIGIRVIQKLENSYENSRNSHSYNSHHFNHQEDESLIKQSKSSQQIENSKSISIQTSLQNSNSNHMQLITAETIKIMKYIRDSARRLVRRVKELEKRNKVLNDLITKKQLKIKQMTTDIEHKNREISQFQQLYSAEERNNQVCKDIIKSMEKEKHQLINLSNKSLASIMGLNSPDFSQKGLEESIAHFDKQKLMDFIKNLSLRVTSLEKQKHQEVMEFRISYKEEREKYQDLLTRLKALKNSNSHFNYSNQRSSGSLGYRIKQGSMYI